MCKASLYILNEPYLTFTLLLFLSNFLVLYVSLLPQVCVHNGNIHSPVNQLHATCRIDSLFAVEKGCVEESAALRRWYLHHQPKLLPGTLSV